MSKIVYATKAWNDLPSVMKYHPNVDMLIINNSPIQIIDIGETTEPYYQPELRAVNAVGEEDYILWYAGDVIPPKTDWVPDALKLLKDYPIVSPFWEQNYDDYIRTAEREAKGGFKLTEFGFEDQFFSDQAYLAYARTMKNIDYNLDHPIKHCYPPHGGNSFECRVAQWLASTDQKRAVLKNHTYRHITRSEK